MAYLKAASKSERDVARELLNDVIPFEEIKADNYKLIREAVGNSKVVLIGEATHGTEDFYKIRADITKALIAHEGFNFVAIEGDWPDVYRINRYVQWGPNCKDKDANEALQDFGRFPTWMWRNEVVADFIEWLRQYNGKNKESFPQPGATVDHPSKLPVGFYGLDLYSLYTSASKVIDYLEEADSELAEQAREKYAAFELFKEEMQDYGVAVWRNLIPSQEENVVKILTELMKLSINHLQDTGGYVNGEELYHAQENAALVKDAEEYYRNIFAGGVKTWNLRDTHMFRTLKSLLGHYSSFLSNKEQSDVRAIVWAHNSHIGDAAATEYSSRRELNVGMLCRNHFRPNNTFHLGFTTSTGTVTAAKNWGGRRQRFDINIPLKGSYEQLFHLVSQELVRESQASTASASTSSPAGVPPPSLSFRDPAADFGIPLKVSEQCRYQPSDLARKLLSITRPERMIGVQYVKDREVQSHYIDCSLANQFNFVIHVEHTEALIPLDRSAVLSTDTRETTA